MFSKEDGESFRVRLSGLIAQDGRPYADIARAIGETPQLMSKWLNTNALTRLPAANYVLKLADCLGVNVRWLISGEGAKYPDFGPASLNKVEIPFYDIRSYYDNSDIKLMFESIRNKSFDSKELDYEIKDNFIYINVVGMGPVIYKKDYLYALKARPESCIRMKSPGDSMAQLIRSDDIILVDCSAKEILNNEVYVLGYQDSVYMGRLIKQFNKLSIRCDNPAYSEVTLTEEATQEVHILGRVVERCGPL